MRTILQEPRGLRDDRLGVRPGQDAFGPRRLGLEYDDRLAQSGASLLQPALSVLMKWQRRSSPVIVR